MDNFKRFQKKFQKFQKLSKGKMPNRFQAPDPFAFNTQLQEEDVQAVSVNAKPVVSYLAIGDALSNSSGGFPASMLHLSDSVSTTFRHLTLFPFRSFASASFGFDLIGSIRQLFGFISTILRLLFSTSFRF